MEMMPADDPTQVVADLAYEAATRGLLLHQEAVKQYRASIAVIVSAGVAGLAFLAKATVDAIAKAASPRQYGWAITAGVCSGLFLIGALVVLRLRSGLFKTQDVASIVALQRESPSQIKVEIAQAIEQSVIDGQAELRKLLGEGAALALLLALAVTIWIYALANAI